VGTCGRPPPSTRPARTSSRWTGATGSPAAGASPGGCLHAHWLLLGAFVPESPAPVLLLVPRDQARIEDTWFVSGLRGTASNDVVIDEPVFVPSHRVVPMAGAYPDAVAAHGRPTYGAPVPSLIPWTLVTPLIGMAQGALNTYEQKTRTRLTSFSQQEVSKAAGPQMRIAEASAAIEAAKALARQDIREMIERGGSLDTFTDEDRVRLRRDHAYAASLAYDATMMLARASGARSILDTHPMQRFMRDAHAAALAGGREPPGIAADAGATGSRRRTSEAGRAPGLTSEEREELKRLRRENRTLKEERETPKGRRLRVVSSPPWRASTCIHAHQPEHLARKEYGWLM